MTSIPINGIRLGQGLVWTGQDTSGSGPGSSVCRALSDRRINMVCAGLHRHSGRERFSACVESRHREVAAGPAADVALVSVYPHRRRLAVPLAMMKMLAQEGIPFYHLVSSPAVLSAVIDTRHQDTVIRLLETTFDLPPSHTPYIQEIDQDISALLKKYPETRSAYVEEKIKTYGIQLIPGVFMRRIRDHQDLEEDLSPDALFHLVSMIRMPGADSPLDAVVVLDKSRGPLWEPADLITFHGPHFGDRCRILQTALTSLDTARIPLLAAACAGASISLLFPAGTGPSAQTALAKGFDAP